MIYITLDTDVWLKLLHDVNQNTDEIGPFDELMFWLEQGHVKLVLPQNIKREWERNKESTIQAAKRELKKNFQSGRELFKNHSALSSFYDPDQYENFVRGRVQRIDKLFASCEIAHTTDEVMIKAGKRSLECLAPNHTGDSFRDSVNIISLMDHLISKGYLTCFFASDNFKDFSEPNGPEAILHNQLATDFKQANLEYVYTGRALIYRKLKAQLPNYSDFLVEERRKAGHLITYKGTSIDPLFSDALIRNFLDLLQIVHRGIVTTVLYCLEVNLKAFDELIIELTYFNIICSVFIL
jgi:hypothetical protein